MNIFFTDTDPVVAAKNLCDLHVHKVGILESAQLLCNLFENAPYRKTHVNHPCTRWLWESPANVSWLICHAKAASIEYTARYGKVHKSTEVIQWVESMHQESFDTITPPALAMPDECKVHLADPIASAVASYRKYYQTNKAKIATWKTRPPEWFNQ
jgi:hypothetical protein